MPKFRRWHRASVFGAGPRIPLDRERRAQFRAKLLLQRRPGRLTIAAAAIGRVLIDTLGVDGRLDPSLATIAEKARVSIATVKRALAQLRACGFVAWTRRLIRDRASGWRTEQASSAYVLAVPSTEAHFERPVRKQSLSLMPPAADAVSPADRKAAQEALAVRCRAVQAALGARYRKNALNVV